ncbi:hypothetical protein ACROYT_G040933 [Oculina patagonica]
MDDNPELQNSIPLKPLRHQSSYENMSGVSFADESDHQYDELHAHDRRKRPNRPIPVPNNSGGRIRQTRQKANEAVSESADSCEGSRRDAPLKIFRILAFVGFSFALVVLLAVMLLAAGVLSPSSCHECTKDLVPSKGQAAGLKQELLLVIKKLSSNISELNAMVRSKDEIISQLQTQDVELTGKIAELERKTRLRGLVVNNTNVDLSSLAGRQGPQGFAGAAGPRGENGLDGKTGKRGPGNMTSCHYISKEGVPFTADTSGIGHKVNVTEQSGYKILGVVCSTFGTAEYNVKSEINSTTNVRLHECECKGKSNVFQAEEEQAKCIMHYWVCPLIVS